METHLPALGWLCYSRNRPFLADMLPQVRNHHLVLGGFTVFPKLKEVAVVGRSREGSSVGMTLLVAGSNSTTLTKNRALSVPQHLGQMRE